MRDATHLGIDACLIKPVEKSLLLETIVSILAKKEQSVSADTPVVVEKAFSRLQGAYVLLAEDNDINQQIALEFLTDVGVKIDIAENGREAVEKVLHGGTRYDAILMDIQMPEMDGLAATHHIRAHFNANYLPIIAMTAHAMESERQRCLAAGMNDHITKPIVPAVLFEALERWIRPRETDATKSEPESLSVATDHATEGGLPDTLPPFNLTAAIARMMGKRALVYRALLDFHKRFYHAPEEFEQLLTGNRRDDLLRLTHTLKGIAATLEATTLAKAAGTLENALLNEPATVMQPLVETVITELAPALTAAAHLLSSERSAQEAVPLPPLASSSNIDLVKLRQHIVELQTLLEKHSTKARKALLPLREALVGCHLETHLNTLSEQLDRFDFRGAENTLATITAGLPPQESSV